MEELAYAMITPYSLLKSRTGGIIGRLLLADLELVGARMYAPSDEFVDEYCKTLEDPEIDTNIREGLIKYVNEYFRARNRLNISNRCPVLLFRGKNALEELRRVVGPLTRNPTGDTVRGTYGDFIGYATGELKYFEPAVLIATNHSMRLRQLELLARYADTDGGVLSDVIRYPRGVTPEETLVLIKPESFATRSTRAGNIIDLFSRGGLYIIAMKVIHMSVAQAEEFYAPLREIFVRKLKPNVAERLRDVLSRAFEYPIPDEVVEKGAGMLAVPNAEHEFNRIVEYMTGINPRIVRTAEEKMRPGEQKCLALVYQGPCAIAKIRELLGSTNPAEAEPGTVRSVYGEDLMRNGAHASDSAESAERERRILSLSGEEEKPSEFKSLILSYLDSCGTAVT